MEETLESYLTAEEDESEGSPYLSDWEIRELEHAAERPDLADPDLFFLPDRWRLVEYEARLKSRCKYVDDRKAP